MDNFNLTNFITKFGYKKVQVNNIQNTSTSSSVNESFSTPQSSTPTSNASSSSAQSSSANQMTSLANNETAVYIKDLMKMPKNLNEFIYMIQNGVTQIQLSRLLSQQHLIQKNLISPTQAQILAQLQGLSTSELQATLKSQINTDLLSTIKNLQISSTNMINLAQLTEFIQSNGKEAITKLIISMANASKQGITDLTQLKDTAKLINASIALTSQDNATQTLKTLLLLYLPWLPLQEGVDFELEIKPNPDNEENDSILVITISTVNFGKVIATLILETSNSVHVNIECSDKFPKEELQLRIEKEEQHYSMQSVVSFEAIKTQPDETTNTKATVSMSAMSEINPFMLLMAHSIIRNTIMIDNEATNGIVTHTD